MDLPARAANSTRAYLSSPSVAALLLLRTSSLLSEYALGYFHLSKGVCSAILLSDNKPTKSEKQ